MTNAFSGKRIRQNSAKLEQIGKRERRLNKIGLSLTSFSNKDMDWVAYFKRRNELKQGASK